MASYSYLYHLFLLTSSLVLLRVEAAGSNPPSLGHPKQSRKCYPEDFAALQAFAATFNSTLTPFFGTHWKPHLDCCSWEGVACASSSAPYHVNTAQNHWRVTGLSLRSKGLTGPLPPSLCRLSALSSLDLSHNNLFGPIPACVGHNLTALNRLILASNEDLSGSISPIANLSQLTHLDLLGNSFSETISAIANLSQLTYLVLAGNSFSGTIPAWNITRLQRLDLSENYFSSGFARLNTNPQLQYLGLSYNQWKEDIPSLPRLRHLEELHLDETSMPAQGSSISGLFCDLISLKKLSIAGSPGVYMHELRYSESDSEHGAAVGRLEYQLPCEKPSVNLTYLDLSNNKLTGPFPPWIGLFANLQHLDLSANAFSGSIPQAWQSLTNLTFLQLSSNSPSPDPTYNEAQLPDWLFRLPLQTLTLRSIGLTSTPQCESGLSLLNQTLEVLDLSDNHLSDGPSLWQCLAHHNFTRFSELYLSNNSLAFNLSHSHPLSELSLGTLDLSYCLLFGTLTMELLSSIGRLRFSTGWLFLAHNDLSGNIPTLDPSTAKNLTKLDLSFNKLTGPLPTWLAKLQRCNYIALNNNHLDGEISTQGLGPSFVNEVLLLGHNDFGKAIFHDAGNGALAILDLSYNKLEGDLHELLGDYSVMANLFALILSHNQLTGAIPPSLGTSAPSLVVLELSFNNLTGAIPNSLKMLSELKLQSPESPLIDFPWFADFDLQSVKGVKFSGSRFRGYLDLSSNLLNGSIPPALGELLMLNELNLSRNHLSGHIPPSLGNLTRLESLDLSYNNLQGSIPTTLSQISSLEVFNVSFNPELSGQIPGGPQFEMEDSYKGDSKVCGPQILRDCDDAYSEPPTTQSYDLHSNEQNGFWNWIERWVTIPGVCIGYGLGFGVTIWILHFYRR